MAAGLSAHFSDLGTWRKPSIVTGTCIAELMDGSITNSTVLGYRGMLCGLNPRPNEKYFPLRVLPMQSTRKQCSFEKKAAAC